MGVIGSVFEIFEARIDSEKIDHIVRSTYSDVVRIKSGLLIQISAGKKIKITWDKETYPLKIKIRDDPPTVQEVAHFIDPLITEVAYEWRYRRFMKKEINKLKEEILAKETKLVVAIEE